MQSDKKIPVDLDSIIITTKRSRTKKADWWVVDTEPTKQTSASARGKRKQPSPQLEAAPIAGDPSSTGATDVEQKQQETANDATLEPPTATESAFNPPLPPPHTSDDQPTNKPPSNKQLEQPHKPNSDDQMTAPQTTIHPTTETTVTQKPTSPTDGSSKPSKPGMFIIPKRQSAPIEQPLSSPSVRETTEQQPRVEADQQVRQQTSPGPQKQERPDQTQAKQPNREQNRDRQQSKERPLSPPPQHKHQQTKDIPQPAAVSPPQKRPPSAADTTDTVTDGEQKKGKKKRRRNRNKKPQQEGLYKKEEGARGPNKKSLKELHSTWNRLRWGSDPTPLRPDKEASRETKEVWKKIKSKYGSLKLKTR